MSDTDPDCLGFAHAVDHQLADRLTAALAEPHIGAIVDIVANYHAHTVATAFTIAHARLLGRALDAVAAADSDPEPEPDTYRSSLRDACPVPFSHIIAGAIEHAHADLVSRMRAERGDDTAAADSDPDPDGYRFPIRDAYADAYADLVARIVALERAFANHDHGEQTVRY